MHKLKFIIFIVMFLISEIISVSAFNTTFMSSTDAYLDQNSPKKNRGLETLLRIRSWSVGFTPNDNFRTLIRFNLSTIPADANISNVQLKLCLDTISGDKSTRMYAAHRVLKNWVENEVTATKASNSIPWDNYFGDFNSLATDTVQISKVTLTNKPKRFISWDVTKDVQNFVNKTLENNGWLILDESENNRKFYETRWVSKESSSIACGANSSSKLEVNCTSGCLPPSLPPPLP